MSRLNELYSKYQKSREYNLETQSMLSAIEDHPASLDLLLPPQGACKSKQRVIQSGIKEVNSRLEIDQCGRSSQRKRIKSRAAKVKKELKVVGRWIDQHCSEGQIPGVLSTVKSHAVLHVNSDCLAELPQAQLKGLKARVEKIWPKIDQFNTPSFEAHPTQTAKRLNTLNRQLFVGYDAAVDRLINPSGSSVSCAGSVVEWAENVIPQFGSSTLNPSGSASQGAHPDRLKNTFLAFLAKSYKKAPLKKHLSESWRNVLANIKLHGDDPKKSAEFCETLSVSMCYPARKSMPVASQIFGRAKSNENPQPLSWAEVVDMATLNEEYVRLGEAHCQKVIESSQKGSRDASDDVYFGCQKMKDTFCSSFWTDVAKGYQKSIETKLDSSLKARFETNDYLEIIQEFKGTLAIMGETIPCP